MQKKRVERLAEQHGLIHPEGGDQDDVANFLQELFEVQPMATAPKDGREVLVKVEYRAGVRGKWLVGHYQPGGFCIDDHPAIDEGWYFWNGCLFDRASKPIGWTYLPDDEKE